MTLAKEEANKNTKQKPLSLNDSEVPTSAPICIVLQGSGILSFLAPPTASVPPHNSMPPLQSPKKEIPLTLEQVTAVENIAIHGLRLDT